jgi:hypothetical protein
LGDPLKGNLLLFYKPLHLEAQQVSTGIEVCRHQRFLSASFKALVLAESLPSNVFTRLSAFFFETGGL